MATLFLEKFSVPCPLCPTRARFLPYHLNSAHSKADYDFNFKTKQFKY